MSPFNLRKAIEEAERQKSIQKSLEKKADEEKARRDKESSANYAELEKREYFQANQYFDQFLMPIFTDIASAKKIPMRKPTGGLFKLYEYGVERSGFIKSHVRGDLGNSVEGFLCWDVRYLDKNSEYQYLRLAVNSKGLLDSGYQQLHHLMRLNLLESGSLDKLYSSVKELIINSNGCDSSHDYSDTTDLGPP